MLPFLVALQLAAAQPRPSRGVSPADSLVVRAHVDSVTLAFLSTWTESWRSTQREHQSSYEGEYVRDDDERGAAAHCHWYAAGLWVSRRIIKGSVPAHATCPRFLPPDPKFADDERRSIDNGLSAEYRSGIRVARTRLRAVLDSAAVVLPHDIELARQRVRFALDAGDVRDAVEAAASCGYALASCGLLQGLILYHVGDVARADSTFAAALSFMAPEDRCAWSDVRVLLDRDARARYQKLSCDERTDFNARFWWLADPLWSEPGNERRVEHLARKVTAQLIAPLGTDGRQHFLPRNGGEAVLESLVRYGWPSRFFWPGPTLDRSHDTYLLEHGAALSSPYLVREYSREGRLHTVPQSAALDDPFAATRDAWQLTAPDGDDNWWPVEHYARDRSALVELPVGQTVMLRRRDSTRFVWAGELDSATRGRTSDTNRSVIVFDSRSVGDVKRVASFSVRNGTRAIVDALLASGKTLLGVEISGDSTHAAARARYAVAVLPALSALHGARAVSQAVLFDPPRDAAPVVNTDAAINRMYPTTTLVGTDRIGVYWEGYGFSPTDTLDLTVRIVRKDHPSIAVRAVRVFGIGRAGDDSIGIHWREIPQNSRAIQRMEGTVPIQLRSLVLDLSKLPRGDYVLELAMNKPGEPPVLSERLFELR